MIKIENVSKTFGQQLALDNIDLFIQESEIFGLIGKSGAGKSTLLRCMNVLERPTSGSIIVDGVALLSLSQKDLRLERHKIGMIFQHFNLVHAKTVFENIALPMRILQWDEARIKEKVLDLLELVGLSEKAAVFPGQLSGGQKQRVAIARALSTDPKILLCDEATSALDPETTHAILELLQKINRLMGITIVIITHEMAVVKHICHRVGIMSDGKLIEITSLSGALTQEGSQARQMLYRHLTPPLPDYLKESLSVEQTQRPLLRLEFNGEETATPFISQMSRALHIDINILLANIDTVDTMTCGVLIVALSADLTLLSQFMQQCGAHGVRVEILGYLHDVV